MPMNVLCPHCGGHTYPTGTHGGTLDEGKAEFRCRNCKRAFVADSPTGARFAPAAELPQSADGVDWAKKTKAELYERAQDLDIEGRSEMNKAQLLAAVREHQ